LVAPADLVTAAAEAARPGYAAKGVHLTAHADAGLPPVSADADRIGQVLAGLLAIARAIISVQPTATARKPGLAAPVATRVATRMVAITSMGMVQAPA
jgi:nitrogen-specific signal transduction histidine kinase